MSTGEQRSYEAPPILRCEKAIYHRENLTRSMVLVGEFPLACETTVIGRRPRELSHLSCWDGAGSANEDFSVRLNDVLYLVPRTVLLSRNHAAITCEGDHGELTYWIEDLKSGSGIHLNGVQVGHCGKVQFSVGDEIRVGNIRLELRV